MKKLIILSLIVVSLIAVSSCYKNYFDISENTLGSINNVSFRNDIVPIMISGACGCHNNENANDPDPIRRKQVSFSHFDTIYYSAILSRSGVFDKMAKGGEHPGEGSVFFTPSQAAIIKAWVAQGAKDDYIPPPITGTVTFTANILPIYKTDCKGGSCHGGTAVTLDYNILVRDDIKPKVQAMMNTLGASSHPGGAISVAPATAATFLAWIAQGYKN